MDERVCAEIREQLEAYAVGALDELERKRVDEHLAECPSCRRLADELLEVAHALPAALAAASRLPLPDLAKQRVLRAIEAETSAARGKPPVRTRPSSRRTSPPWLRPRAAGVFVTVAVAIVSLAWNAHLSSALSQERSLRTRLAEVVGRQEVVLDVVDSKRTKRTFLLPPEGSRSRAYGKLFTRPDSRFVVAMAARLPQPPAGRTYHLWLAQAGQTRLAGEMIVTKGFTLLVLKATRPGPVYDAARITLQPKGPGPEAATPVLTFGTTAVSGAGGGRPRVSVSVKAVGQWRRLVTLRLTDNRSGKPIRGATVTALASMNRPGHSMTLARKRLLENKPGSYSAEIQFVMVGAWTVKITAGRPESGPASVRLRIDIPQDEPPDVAASP